MKVENVSTYIESRLERYLESELWIHSLKYTELKPVL